MKNYTVLMLFLLVSKVSAQVGFSEVTSGNGISKPDAADYSYSSTMVDVDNDDWLDLFIAHGNDHYSSFNQLFHNLKNGKFLEITSTAFSSAQGAYTGGHCWGDFDNDGFPDLYESHFNSEDNKVWKNNGDLTFTEASGLFTKHSIAATGAIWSDVDLDGKLDLLVHTQSGAGSFCFLNRNNGFKDTSILHSYCIGDEILTTDFNDDNRPDYLFGNAHGVDSLFFSMGTGYKYFSPKFLSDVRNLADYPGSATLGDIDEDGYPDIIITYPNKFFLFHNEKGLAFEDWTSKLHLDLAKPKVHLGSFICDLDNDGYTDIVILNRSDTSQIWYGSSVGFTKQDLPINSFNFISGNAIQSLAIGDYDNDGFIDLLHCKQGETHLWHNDGNVNRWMNIKLRGHQANYQGLGAKVTSYIGTNTWHWTMGFSQGYYGHISEIAHFGFGPPSCASSDMNDSLVIIWQPGGRQVLKNVRMNEFIVVDQDSGIVRHYDKPVSSGFGNVYPYRSQTIITRPDTICAVPLSIRLASLNGIDTMQVDELTFSLTYDDKTIDISPTKVSQRYTPPPGWKFKSSKTTQDTLSVTISNIGGSKLSDSIFLGTLRFDTYASDNLTTNIFLEALSLVSGKRLITFCMNIEGSVVTRVIIDTAPAASVKIQRTQLGTLSISPNPTTADIIVTSAGPTNEFSDGVCRLIVTDVLGREIYSSTGSVPFTVPSSNFAPGVYIVEISKKTYTASGRLVVQ